MQSGSMNQSFKKVISHIPPELPADLKNTMIDSSEEEYHWTGGFIGLLLQDSPRSKTSTLPMTLSRQLYRIGASLINSGKAYANEKFKLADFNNAFQEILDVSREDHLYHADDVRNELIVFYNNLSTPSNKIYGKHEFEHTQLHRLFVCRVALDHLQPQLIFALYHQSMHQRDFMLADTIALYVESNWGMLASVTTPHKKEDILRHELKYLTVNKFDGQVIKAINNKTRDYWKERWNKAKVLRAHEQSQKEKMKLKLESVVRALSFEEAVHERIKPTVLEYNLPSKENVSNDNPPKTSVPEKTEFKNETKKEEKDEVKSEVKNENTKGEKVKLRIAIPTDKTVEKSPMLGLKTPSPKITREEEEKLKQLAELGKALAIVATNAKDAYANQYKDSLEASYFFSPKRILDFGHEGQVRAENFDLLLAALLSTLNRNQCLRDVERIVKEMLQAYKDHFSRIESHWSGSHGGNLYDYSLDTFLLKCMADNAIVAAYFTLSPTQLQDELSRYNARNAIIEQLNLATKNDMIERPAIK